MKLVRQCTWRKGVAAILATGAMVFPLNTAEASRQPGVWKTYTSKKNVRDVVVGKGVVWSATRGGMFSMHLADTVFQEFSTSEGLRTNDLSAITLDRSGVVWTGATNGMIHSYNPLLAQWNYITDLARFPDPQRRVDALEAIGDTLYIGSEIGLSLYSLSRGEFGITARAFGSGLEIRGNVLGIALHRDSIWVATIDGVAVAPRFAPNLNSPTSWRVFQTQNGIPSNRVTSFTVYRNTLYAGTERGLARYDGSSWSSIGGTAGKDILRLLSNQEYVYCLTSSEVLKVDSSGNVTSVTTPSSLTSFALEDSELILGSNGNGVYVQRSGMWEAHVPKGPPTSNVIGLAVDVNGVLWTGTGTASSGPSGELGFMSFDGKKWTSYTLSTHPMLQSNAYYRVDVGHGNVKWISSFGAGVALVGSDGELKRVYNRATGLPHSAGVDFVVVGGVVTDGEGKAWIAIRTGNGDTTFAVVSGDSIVSYVVRPNLGGDPRFGDVAIDQRGTKWLIESRFSPGSGAGTYFYNERGFGDNDTSRWRRLSEQDGLVSNKTSALVVDLNGQIWLGTDRGINLIINPAFVGSDRRLRPQIAFYVPLSGQGINALAVDPLNNKWVGTNQGVFVLSADGTSILAHYSVENTDGKLVANEVQSIAIDFKTGLVYIGSERGLSTLTTSSVAPARSFDGLSIAPNPYYIPSTSSVSIDGLVQNSSLKILSIDGHVVRHVKTPGGRVGFWDGRDSEGNYVSSGIYLVVAFSENGNEVAVGKIAVIRKQ